MIEVDYGGGGHHTRLRINDQLVSSRVPPTLVYKGGEEERADQGERRAQGGGAILLQVGLPPLSLSLALSFLPPFPLPSWTRKG